jgi:hypothetical protein
VKRTGKQAIETHDISQRKYPMPGTDLGSTTAVPFNDAYDVDLSGGSQCQYQLGTGDNCSNMSRIVDGCNEDLKPAFNPTRHPRERQPWELGANASVAPSMPKRKR